MKSTQYNFSVNEDDIVDLGDTNSAVYRMLEVSFGKCSKTNGIVPIKKGPGITAIVGVLRRCLTEDPRDAHLALWLENISVSAEAA